MSLLSLICKSCLKSLFNKDGSNPTSLISPHIFHLQLTVSKWLHSFTSLSTPSLHSSLLHFTLHSFTSLSTPSLHSSLLHFTLHSFTSLFTPSLHSSLLHFTLHFTLHSFTSFSTPSLHSSLLHFTLHSFHFTLHFTLHSFTSLSTPSLHSSLLMRSSCFTKSTCWRLRWGFLNHLLQGAPPRPAACSG